MEERTEEVVLIVPALMEVAEELTWVVVEVLREVLKDLLSKLLQQDLTVFGMTEVELEVSFRSGVVALVLTRYCQMIVLMLLMRVLSCCVTVLHWVLPVHLEHAEGRQEVVQVELTQEFVAVQEVLKWVRLVIVEVLEVLQVGVPPGLLEELLVVVEEHLLLKLQNQTSMASCFLLLCPLLRRSSVALVFHQPKFPLTAVLLQGLPLHLPLYHCYFLLSLRLLVLGAQALQLLALEERPLVELVHLIPSPPVVLICH